MAVLSSSYFTFFLFSTNAAISDTNSYKAGSLSSVYPERQSKGREGLHSFTVGNSIQQKS